MKPQIEDLQSYIPTPPSRPVLLVESKLDVFGDTLAFTECVDGGEEGDAAEEERDAKIGKYFTSRVEGELDELPEDEEDDLGALPAGLCVVVVFPDKIENERMLKFSLAHEWMHTMQNGFYTRSTMERDWWVEGSAEWFAHKVLDGVTERDERIQQFFDRQEQCPLTKHSYDAQPYFFWGEQAFDASWVFSVGLGGAEYLTRPARAAEILPPERWLDWAIAQSERTITMPDGRHLPVQAEPEALTMTEACATMIEGPPLSVQLREVSVPEGTASKLHVEAGDAQVALRGPDGEWMQVTGTAEIDPPGSPMTVAAIMPSGDDLSVRLSIDNDDRMNCACHIGTWIEQPTEAEDAEDILAGAREAMEAYKDWVPPDQRDELAEAESLLRATSLKDRFRFRGEIEEFAEMGGESEVTYLNDGPLITIAPGGTFEINDPYVMVNDESAIKLWLNRYYGRWTTEDGVLDLDIDGHSWDGTISWPGEVRSYTGTNEEFAAQSYVGGGGDWNVSCEYHAMTLVPGLGNRTGPGREAKLVRR